MLARRYLAWRLVVEADEADRRDRERQELVQRRRLNVPSRISATHFVQRYRLTKEGFVFLCDTLRENTNLRSSQRISLETKVLSALLFYANGDYQRVVGIANSLSQEAISRYIHQVTMALNHPIVVKKFINFYNKYGIPGVIGCVDGCHFKIFKPNKEEEHLYYCRKHYHSLNVQMVADEKCRILAINPKFGGASHDAFVWENSQLNTYMQTLHQSGESVWLLGDSGYAQRPWLMTPYSNPAPGTAAESYNKVHSRARVTIENTFGRLKNRWRCVCKDRVLHYKPEKCAQIILACSVLHNIALDFGVPDPQGPIIATQEFQRNEINQQEEASLLTLGRLIRDRVASRVHAGAIRQLDLQE
ncbi:Uncharacterized protein OBRU01_24000 [Operophtera brumata]|uniref:Uncharacterized protein n=1 Tax=Operophtera brumata TaxID=104452 RepID=A0A0L7KN87_OPEBR|nr:Uncharacterized protein OBRU01_24000 [Operophtera brumata]